MSICMEVPQTELLREIIVDNFCGGGGVSTGAEQATGRDVEIAINHDPEAIAMHKTNHPNTTHYCESVWEVDPREAVAGRPVGLAWFSPDCKHFSKAKGGKPVEKHIRGLAWVVVRWAATVKPRVIILENVEEFKDWGPLIPKTDPKTGRMLKITPEDEEDKIVVSEPGEYVPPEVRCMIPDPKKKGLTFKLFVKALKRQGYHVEWKELRACDFGAPTIRRRLFLLARADDKPIVWPKPTHGDPNSPEVKSGRLKPWRTAAEIIDFTLKCPSIFNRKKPLAEKTMRRIAKGIFKFVLNNPNPFIIEVNHDGEFRGQELDKPMKTITSKNGWGLVMPVISRQFGNSVGHSVSEPLGTVTAGGGGKSQLVAAFLAQYHTETNEKEVRGQSLEKPILTIDTSNRYALVSSHLIKFRGTNIGHPATEPLHAITAQGNHLGEVRAFLMKYYGADVGQSCNDPLHTVTTKDRFGLVTIKGQDYQIVDIGMRMLEPYELFAAMSFPKDYAIDMDYNGKKYPKSAQVARCGNAVPPVMAKALVRANLPELCGIVETHQAIANS